MKAASIPPRTALVLAACALLILAFAPAQYFGRQQDDVLFLVGAKAMSLGRFCLLTTPGCPPLTMIDPLWPAMLAPLARFTENPAPFQLLSALLLALAPAGLWFWLRRRTDETTALLAAALFASCPLVLEQAGVVMSEVPFVLFLVAALSASDAGLAGATGALGACLLLTRTAGLACLPGLVLRFRSGNRRNLAAAAVPPAAAAACWWAWSWTSGRVVGKFELLPTTYGRHSFLLKPLAVAALNARWYAAEWGGCFLPPSWADGPLAPVLGVLLGAAAARGVWLALRRRTDDPAAWTLLGSCALLAIWGWQYERYLIPVLPLLLWALAAGLGRAAKPALAVLLALQFGAQVLPRLGKPSPWAEPELARTYVWLAARPRPALLASSHPMRDGWLSDLPNVSLPDAPTADAFVQALKAERVSYILRADGQDFGLEQDQSSTLVTRLARAHAYLDDPRRFRLVHEEPAERAEIYEPR